MEKLSVLMNHSIL